MKLTHSRKIRDLGAMNALAKEIAEQVKDVPFFVLLFEGTLAAGKTTLIQMIGSHLGIAEHMQSPTYTIIRSYKTKIGTPFHHIDLYRISGEEELNGTGISDLLGQKAGLFCIEWPKHGGLECMGSECLSVQIELTEDTRVVHFS